MTKVRFILCSNYDFFSSVSISLLPAEVLGHLPGGELGLTDVAKVPRQVDRLPLHQAGQQGHIAGLSSPGWQSQPQSVELVSKLLSAILRFCPEKKVAAAYLFSIYLRSTPPRREALRHSGGKRRLCTSPMVTLYFDVEERRESLPGTEQKTSEEETVAGPTRRPPPLGLQSSPRRPQTTCGSPPHYPPYPALS